MFKSVALAFNRYADFSGRSSRSEFWYFVFFCFLLPCATFSVILLLSAFLPIPTQTIVFTTLSFFIFFILAIIIPKLAVLVRRLHDTNRSAWWLLLFFVPLIGNLMLLIFLCQDSDPGNNDYGPNPK